MSLIRSIPSPRIRPHGLFIFENEMWLADTQDCKIHKLDPDSGTVPDEIEIPEPEICGMTLHEREIWFYCVETRRVCTVPLPD